VSWSDLAYLGLQVRPLSDIRPEPAGERSRFQSTLRSTVAQLSTELRQLDADHIILELDLRDRDIRIDGYPRADARPGSPAVVLSFDSKFGPLRYATAEYDDWRDNLRAIALSMQALRAVDRYGVSKRGEQYSGWKQLMPSSDPADAISTAGQARAYLDEHYGGDIRRALMETHPDKGGDPDEFRKVQRARELIDA
jgi:hypothetical protein